MKNQLAWLLVPLCLSGCNFFSIIDSPSGDTQVLSAARACLDSGDYDCALKNYEKLSSADNDVRLSEEALSVLDQSGATMAAFLGGFGKKSGGTGSALTLFANAMIGSSPSQPTRMNIYNAYVSYQSIQSTNLRAFVQFMTALALAGEILAETAQGSALLQTDLAAGPAACAASVACATAGATSCAAPADSKLDYGAGGAFDLDTTAPSATRPTIQYLVAALTSASNGLSSLGTSGNFGDTTSQLKLLSNEPAGAEPCYRQLLLTTGIGN